MPQGFYAVRPRGHAAAGTGADGITRSHTRRLDYLGFLIVMPQCGDLVILVAVAAFAGMEGIALLCAGGLDDRFRVTVLCVRSGISAAGAGQQTRRVAGGVVVAQSRDFGVGIAVAAFALVQGIARLGAGRGDDGVGVGVFGGHFIDRLGDALFNAQAVGVVGEFQGDVLLRRAAFGRFQAAPLCPREVPQRAVVVPDGVAARRRAGDVAVLVHRLALVDDLLAVKGGQEVLPRGAAVGIGVCRFAARDGPEVARAVVGVGVLHPRQARRRELPHGVVCVT